MQLSSNALKIQGKLLVLLPTYRPTLAKLALSMVLLPLWMRSEASPWIDAGDFRTRHHLLVLNDAGKLQMPLNTWPVMWSGVKSALDNLRAESLTDQELWSYQYLRHQLKRAMRTTELRARGHVASHESAFDDFAGTAQDQTFAELRTTLTTEYFAVNLQREYVYEPLDGHENRYDGSYIATTLGNWVFGAGAQARWWGPGWQNSAILSHNARPTPAVFLQRKDASANQHTFGQPLSWDLHLFAGQLQQHNYQENPRFFGLRIAIKPLPFLEVGASGTRLSGGELDDDAGIAAEALSLDEENEQQLSSFDWRINSSLKNTQIALYHQHSRIQVAPHRHADTAGLEIAKVLAGTNHRLTLEYNRNDFSSFEQSNLLFGYRSYERNLGPSFDNNASALTLLGYHFFTNGHQLRWKLGNIALNADNSAPNIYTSTHQHISHANASYALPISDWLTLEAGAQYFSEELALDGSTIASGGYITFNVEF